MVNSARARVAAGRNTAARWQFWNEVAFGGGAHGVAGHQPQQLAPGVLARGRYLVVGEVGAAGAQVSGQVADELPGVGQGRLDAGGERGVVDAAVAGLVEQVRRDGQGHGWSFRCVAGRVRQAAYMRMVIISR